MIDLNSLGLYKNKISSYIDENVLTFPAQSKINSLFSEVHKYKIIMYSKVLKTIKKYINFLTLLFNRMKFYMV